MNGPPPSAAATWPASTSGWRSRGSQPGTASGGRRYVRKKAGGRRLSGGRGRHQRGPAAAAVERQDPGARVRRPVLSAAPGWRGGIRELRRPAALPGATGRRRPQAVHSGHRATGLPTSYVTHPKTSCGVCESGTRTAGSAGRSWPYRWTGRPPATRLPATGAPCGCWSAGRTSTPSRLRRRTAPSWPSSAGITRGCRGTAPSCGWRSWASAGTQQVIMGGRA